METLSPAKIATDDVRVNVEAFEGDVTSHHAATSPRCEDHPGECLYPTQRVGYRDFIKDVSDYLLNVVIPEESNRRETYHLNRLRLSNLLRKARYMGQCGAWVKGIQCKKCDAPLEGSGLLVAGNSPQLEAQERHPRRCAARSCPFCGKRTAQDLRKALTEAIAKVPYKPAYRWRFLTATLGSYDPLSMDSVGTDALRYRAQELMRRFAEMFRILTGIKPGKEKGKATRRGLAAFAALEISGHGHVHLHAVLYGPYVKKEWLEEQFSGFVDIQSLGVCKDKVKEAQKYAAKICSPMDEGWLEGKRRDMIHPELAARWEAATWRVRLRRVFGELHGRMTLNEGTGEVLNEQAQLTEEKPPPDLPCKTCGSTQHWAVVWMPTQQWIEKNHALQQRAFKYSRWKPPKAAKAPTIWQRAEWWEGTRGKDFAETLEPNRNPELQLRALACVAKSELMRQTYAELFGETTSPGKKRNG